MYYAMHHYVQHFKWELECVRSLRSRGFIDLAYTWFEQFIQMTGILILQSLLYRNSINSWVCCQIVSNLRTALYTTLWMHVKLFHLNWRLIIHWISSDNINYVHIRMCLMSLQNVCTKARIENECKTSGHYWETDVEHVSDRHYCGASSALGDSVPFWGGVLIVVMQREEEVT